MKIGEKVLDDAGRVFICTRAMTVRPVNIATIRDSLNVSKAEINDAVNIPVVEEGPRGLGNLIFVRRI